MILCFKIETKLVFLYKTHDRLKKVELILLKKRYYFLESACFLNSIGVMWHCFLNAVLNEDLELKPT